MKPGDLVVAQLPGIVEHVDRHEPRISFRARSASGESYSKPFWVNTENVFAATGLTEDNGWRDACADAIRVGDFDAVFRMLEEKLTVKVVNAFIAIRAGDHVEFNEQGLRVSVTNCTTVLGDSEMITFGIGIRK